MKCAFYLRVSTPDQSVDNQERDLRRWAEQHGCSDCQVYTDTASGTRGDRPAFSEMLAAAERKEYDTLLVWSLDRLSREGIGPMLKYLARLHASGVTVRSYREGWLDTGSPVWEFLAAAFAWVAQQESRRIGERVRAGMARAKTKGVLLGRRRREVDEEGVARRREAGQSWRRIARGMKVPIRTLRRRYKAWQKAQVELRP